MTTELYHWRRGMFAPDVVHLAEIGQPARVTHRYERRWVWSVCERAAMADNGEDGLTTRCEQCLTWVQQEGVDR